MSSNVYLAEINRLTTSTKQNNEDKKNLFHQKTQFFHPIVNAYLVISYLISYKYFIPRASLSLLFFGNSVPI